MDVGFYVFVCITWHRYIFHSCRYILFPFNLIRFLFQLHYRINSIYVWHSITYHTDCGMLLLLLLLMSIFLLIEGLLFSLSRSVNETKRTFSNLGDYRDHNKKKKKIPTISSIFVVFSFAFKFSKFLNRIFVSIPYTCSVYLMDLSFSLLSHL